MNQENKWDIASLYDDKNVDNTHSTAVIKGAVPLLNTSNDLREITVTLFNHNLLNDEAVAEYKDGVPFSKASQYFTTIHAWAEACNKLIAKDKIVDKTIQLYSMYHGFDMLKFKNQNDARLFIEGNGYLTDDYKLFCKIAEYMGIQIQQPKSTPRSDYPTDNEYLEYLNGFKKNLVKINVKNILKVVKECKERLMDFTKYLDGCSVDMILFRGIANELHKGKKLISTSLDPSIASRFANGGQGGDLDATPELMRIKLPKNTKCIPLYKCDVMRPNEYEILLIENLGKFKVIKPVKLLGYSSYGYTDYKTNLTSYISEIRIPCMDYAWKPRVSRAKK